jgi:hypothetical protein
MEINGIINPVQTQNLASLRDSRLRFYGIRDCVSTGIPIRNITYLPHPILFLTFKSRTNMYSKKSLCFRRKNVGYV